jgi:hypothetical protein
MHFVHRRRSPPVAGGDSEGPAIGVFFSKQNPVLCGIHRNQPNKIPKALKSQKEKGALQIPQAKKQGGIDYEIKTPLIPFHEPPPSAGRTPPTFASDRRHGGAGGRRTSGDRRLLLLLLLLHHLGRLWTRHRFRRRERSAGPAHGRRGSRRSRPSHAPVCVCPPDTRGTGEQARRGRMEASKHKKAEAGQHEDQSILSRPGSRERESDDAVRCPSRVLSLFSAAFALVVLLLWASGK